MRLRGFTKQMRPVLTALGFAAALFNAGCVLLRPARVPMPELVLEDAASEVNEYALLLPGRGGDPRDFEKAGFGQALRQAGFTGEIVSADAHMGYFMRRTVIMRLREDVMAARPGQKPWLVGVSLGGFGALLYEKTHPGEVAGIVLLAPFLGQDPVIREIKAAGGLEAWDPGPIAADDYQRDLWMWIKGGGLKDVPVYIGWGSDDAFAEANALLAATVSHDRIAVRPGGHRWPTWKFVFDALLEAGACGGKATPEREG